MTPETCNADVDQLLAEVPGISIFLIASAWHERAGALRDSLREKESALEVDALELDRRIEELRQERGQLPFFERLFRSRKPERQLMAASRAARAFAALCRSSSDRLIAAASQVPRTSVERDTLVRGLRAEKQRLGIEKKELALEMRSIRAEAKASSSALQPGLFTSKEYVAAKRRQIRAEKDEQVGEKEAQKTEIETRAIELERRLLWLQRMSNGGAREVVVSFD